MKLLEKIKSVIRKTHNSLWKIWNKIKQQKDANKKNQKRLHFFKDKILFDRHRKNYKKALPRKYN